MSSVRAGQAASSAQQTPAKRMRDDTERECKNHFYSMEVWGMRSWFCTNTYLTTQLVFAPMYQRDPTKGWDSEKKSQYLKTVMFGTAKTPFVVNKVQATARLIDGGHRLQAILDFMNGKTPMHDGTRKVFYEHLHEDDKKSFIGSKLEVQEFSTHTCIHIF
jgi:hypothetical protein